MAKDKRINVSGTVTPALHEFLENYRWDPKRRLTKSDVVNKALEAWAAAEGFVEPESGEAEAEPVGTETAAADAGAPKGRARRAS